MKIAIDPGHGMSNRTLNVFDSGATHTENNTVFQEADIALRYGLTLKDTFIQKGHTVFMTRDDSTDHAPVGQRAGNAEQAGCDAFVSLHLNDFDDDDANGIEVLYRGDDDEPFAQALQDALITVTGLQDREIDRRTNLAVLRFNGKAVLIELGFIANDRDRNTLLNPAMRASICEAIANVTLQQLGATGGGNLTADAAGVPKARVQPPAGDTLTVRSAPRQTANAIGALAAGTVVEIHGNSGIWRKIAPAAERWVSSRFLVPLPVGGGGPGTGSLSEITQIAANSAIASFNWPQRGGAPVGYIKGMALVFARALCKLGANDPAAIEMAKAATADGQRDALAWYASQYAALGMDNSVSGADTLRHLFVLLVGLGMRESSGEHCCGRDTSAGNFTGASAEAGMFQTSWNARTASPLMPPLFHHYLANPTTGFLDIFAEGVTCSPANQANHGTGTGRDYQRLSKECPAFHAEFTAVGLRNIRRHWGPINTRAAKLMPDADAMFREVQAAVDASNLCPVLV